MEPEKVVATRCIEMMAEQYNVYLSTPDGDKAGFFLPICDIVRLPLCYDLLIREEATVSVTKEQRETYFQGKVEAFMVDP